MRRSDTDGITDPDSKPFFAALERGQLMIQRCGDCRQFQFPPRCFCARCGDRHLDWVEADGRGNIYSFTVCYRAGAAEMTADVPFCIGLVELREKVRMLARLDIEIGDARIGMDVMAAIRRNSDGDATVVFQVAREEAL